MAIRTYLAMTAAEFARANPRPPHIAWMACHFSPYGTGLSNLPSSLPPDSLLILNDRIPICGHDPQRIAEQLKYTTTALGCCGVLLDFQRPNYPETQALVLHLVSSLPCPVCTSDLYASTPNCPVFLPPCPHHIHLEKHIAPWKSHEIWLDLARDAETITVTCHGSTIIPSPPGALPEGGHVDTGLHCHYSVELTAEALHFTLWRTPEDLHFLRRNAYSLGICNTVALLPDFQITQKPLCKNAERF